MFELYSRETGNSFRFSLLIKKRFVTEEIVETENSEALYLAGATASGSGTKTVKKTKTSSKKASTVTKASTTKKTKTSGSGASSETKTSSGGNKTVTK